MNTTTPDSAATPDETSQAQDAHKQALHESEERLRLAMMVANDGFWDWQLTTNEVYFDPRYYLMAGYAVNEFPHRLEEFQQRVHPDDHAQVIAIIQYLLNEQSDRHEVEFRFRRKDGDYLWILSKWLIVERDEQGRPSRIAGTHSDITDRKRTEEALRATEQRLRMEKEFVENLFDVSADTIFVFEPATGKPIRWNDAFRKITGYSDKEIASLTAPDGYFSGEDLSRAGEALQRVFRYGKGTVELSLLTKSGKAIPFEYCASVVPDPEGESRLFISIGRDITERKRTEAELQQKLAELQQWYEVMLGREGRVLELKHEADTLRKRLGEPPRYTVELANDLPAIPPVGGTRA